jgi:pantoate--beta-alanine ligase
MLKMIKSKNELLEIRSTLSGTVGFVPTMGNLHQGHLSLILQSLKENDHTVISIFVNPKQFGPNEDFNKYPRTLEQDIEKINSLKGKSIFLFTPQDNDEIYPPHFSSSISVGELSRILCGKFRPGHFDGVTTVVYLLLNLVKAQKVYMGEKDYQQLTIIKKMVKDLLLPYQIIGMKTVRDEDGLALSSRNQYLSAAQRKQALILPQKLNQIAQYIRDHKKSEFIESELSLILLDKNWDYLEICDQSTLEKPNTFKNIVILGAYRLGQTRLIDNIVLD